MKISSRGRYGLHLLIDLAEHLNEERTSLLSVSERQKISANYIEQIAAILRRAGYIRSVKGVSGGYTLAKNPNQIIVGDVLRVLEGDMLVLDPPLDAVLQTKFHNCIRAAVFDKINEKISEVIDKKTLASLVGINETDEYMYFI